MDGYGCYRVFFLTCLTWLSIGPRGGAISDRTTVSRVKISASVLIEASLCSQEKWETNVVIVTRVRLYII